MTPLISIVISSTNRNNLLKSLYDIKKYTTLDKVEFIIFTNGFSKDQDLISALDGTSYNFIESSEIYSYSKSFNIAVSQAKGQYIISLFDNVLFENQNKDEWIMKILSPMKDEEICISAPYFTNYELLVNTPYFSVIAFKSPIFSIVGGLDEAYENASPAEFCLRAMDSGFDFVKCEDVKIKSEVPSSIVVDDKLLNHYGFTDRYYSRYLSQPSDIFNHLPILREYASKYNHVSEVGMRFGKSTVSILQANPKNFVGYDIKLTGNIRYIHEISQLEGKNFTIKECDILNTEIDKTDFLFIDSKHTYQQLSAELSKHSSKVGHLLAFHDTVTFGEVGEDGTVPGLNMAIDEFLNSNKNWYLKERWTRNNGLTILKKKEEKKYDNSIVLTIESINDIGDKLIKYNTDQSDIIVIANGCNLNDRKLLLNDKFKVIWLENKVGIAELIKISKQAASTDEILMII